MLSQWRTPRPDGNAATRGRCPLLTVRPLRETPSCRRNCETGVDAKNVFRYLQKCVLASAGCDVLTAGSDVLSLAGCDVLLFAGCDVHRPSFTLG